MVYAYYSSVYAGMVEAKSIVVIMQMMYNEQESGTIFQKDAEGVVTPVGTYTYANGGGRYEGWV